MAGQPCRICDKRIEPGEAVSFQEGELIHMTCYRVQSRVTRRRTDCTYKGQTIQVVCYPLMGRWRPAASVESPGRFTRLGPMKLCDNAEEALAFALKTATAWIDKNAAPSPRVQPEDICGEDTISGH